MPRIKIFGISLQNLLKKLSEYCNIECRYLAILMEALRTVCAEAGILPKQWSGAGWLAAALMDKYGVPKRPLTANETAALAEKKPSKNSKPIRLRRPERDREFEEAANNAYYGGRFEISRIGSIPGPVYQYDLRSAYPAAMLDLPCPLHARWEHRPHPTRLPQGKLYLAKISFSHPDGPWCGFPFRQNSSLFWPFQGTGWYWSPEIETRAPLDSDRPRALMMIRGDVARCIRCVQPWLVQHSGLGNSHRDRFVTVTSVGWGRGVGDLTLLRAWASPPGSPRHRTFAACIIPSMHAPHPAMASGRLRCSRYLT